ncbi:Starch-binding associating with outer membrane [Flavobacteriaceae bacterium MAR_2010_188]|nr:Starch-binding associating with outer membrane [Flavobacteriaceae bacterium MAR_2010_188]
MKNMKILKRISILSVMGLALLISCDDSFLDRLPEGEVANTDELGVGGQETAVFGLYSQLRRSAVGQWQRYWFGSIRSDDAAKGSTPGDGAADGTAFNDFDYVATNLLSTSWWNAHYEIIFASNEIINIIEETGTTDEGSLINAAEAKVMRGWMYFELRRDYGEVPIITATIDNPEDAIAPKATVADIDALIESDLTFAAQYLPLTWPNFPGRATSGFANSMLAKLYLYQENWQKSYDKSMEVINSGVYMLDPDLVNLFEIGGDNGVESIFEIQQLVTDNENFADNYFLSQGVRGAGVWDLGWGFNVPTQQLVDAFEAGDKRKNNTILYSGQDDNGFGSGTLPAVPPLPQPYWNKKAYTKQAVRNEFNMNFNRWENIKIVRYADIILMAAEAANELGMTSEAVDLVNQVRSRAGLGLISVTDQASVRAAIKQERRVELAMEEYRFYDLVRWGDAVSVLGSLGYEAKNALYPIPQEAIDQAGGVLVQNPNY